MKRNISRLGASSFALAALGTLIIGGPAVAQQVDDEVVVQSHREFAYASHSLASTHLLTVTRRVSYADLDLATKSGAQELEARVRSTARAICEKLDRKDPSWGSNSGTCFRDAVVTGMTEVRTAIAAARKSTRTAAIGSLE
jgi:UrcA family protein